MIDRLFVYGTLRVGDVRWSFLEPFVAGSGTDDAVDGWLYDTGLGYPAAIFAGTGHPDEPRPPDEPGAPAVPLVHGTTYTLLEASIVRALEVLDHEEDTVEGLYERVVVTTRGGERAWSYQYGAGLDLSPIESGDWSRRMDEWRTR